MAQLKDLMVYGDAKFLANAMLDHDPTLNLEAATKHYVDQAVSGSPQGTVTSITLTQGTGISVSNSGTAITTSGTRTIALDQAFGTEFIVGTQTAATGSWTGVTKRTALYDGMQIAYWLPFAGSGNATLNLTLAGGGTTGAVNCYYNGTTRLTTHYGAGNLVHLTYRSNVNIGGSNYTGWWSNANYDTNDGAYYNRYVYSNSYASGTVGLFPYALVMERSNGTLDSIVTSSSTGTSKACNANGFKLPRVLYYNSTTAASTALATYALYEAYTSLIDARYSFNITTSSLTARLPVYLVGAMGTNGLFFLDTTQWWSQTLPSSNDGKVYIHVGEAYDGYRIILNYDKPIYKYINGMVQQWVPSTGYAASAGTAASATKATNDDSNHQISTYYAHTLTTSGNTIGLEDGNGDDISGSFITVPYATSAGSATSATNASTLLGGTSDQVLISNGTSGVWRAAPYQQIRVANATYNLNAGLYQGSTYNRYIRIKVPNQTIWYMCQLEVSLRGNYTAAEGGKVIINAYHSANSPYTWTALNASVHGKLTNVAVYAADGQYFYIDYNFAYRTVSIDKMLVGDNAVNYDCSNIVVDAVSTLPSTYQTATMLWGVNGSGTSGYLAKWDGTNSLTNGPAITSGGTGFLKQDGTWATPANTTYTLGAGTTTVTLTPSSGNQQSITVPYATSAGRATNDASNRAIETTYAHALTTNGNTIGLEHANGDAISGSFITVPYATASGSLTGGTNGQVLISNGTKGVWTTPTWTTYTFASGKGTTNGFTVTPTGGSATTYSVGALLANEDKRSTSTTPSTYYVANGGLRFLGLKNNSTLGLSVTGAGTYSTGLGVAPWGDNSGGPAWELAFNSAGIFARTGTSTWGSWSKLIQAADLGSLAYVSPSTSGTATTLFLGYDSDAGTYSLMNPSSDHLVSQVNSNNNVAYRVLLSYSDSNSTQINLTYKNSGLTFNPSTGILSSAKIETGSAAASYFQSQRFRGEGDAATYYHAVDFGYASHDRVDFYEYGGIFCFHKHTAAAVGSGDTVLGTITTNGWEGKLKLPNTSTPITGIGSGLAVTSSGSLYCTVTPCLIEGTKILMADGTEKNIEEVVRGDVIMSYDPNVNQTCEAVVLDCVDTGVSDDYINYFFDNGSMLTVYDKHCFYNKEIGTAKDVKKWELGDTGIDQYGQDAMFVGSEELHYAGRKHHYDLRSSNMLFFANGILNAESLTYNYWWHGDDDLPESFRKAMKADYDSSANLHKHQASRDYGMALAPIIKEIRRQEKIIADNKKLLSDSDYIVQKFTEGLIGAVEWAKAKVSRSGWRDLINTAETTLTTAKSRMKTIKAKYATTETRRERFNAAVARDNACLEELKAYFKSKNELSK